MFTREFIENFLQGYNEKELDAIKQDLEALVKFSFNKIPSYIDASTSPIYIATAGGPGSAKSTTLETFLRSNNLMKQTVYADPDAVSLRHMNYTYRESLTYFDFATASSNHIALKNAYDKWRGASNYINHEIMQLAFGGEYGTDAKYSIAHGSTSTSPHIGSLYQRIKARGYRITLLLCYSNDETKIQSIANREREQGFVQCDPNDVVEKGKMFPERFDVYFQYANELFFYWNDDLSHKKLPFPCAKYFKTTKGDHLIISDEKAFTLFCRKYLSDIAALNIPICKTFEKFIPSNLPTTRLPYKKMITENGLWNQLAATQRVQKLRDLLELDTAENMLDEKTMLTIKKRFLFSSHGKKQEYPVIVGIGGGPGAGKSFLYERMKQEGRLPKHSIVHDPDLVMEAIPQYREDALRNPAEAFKKWELVARQLSNSILLDAMQCRYNIIYVRSFALSDSLNFVRIAKTAGYQFEAHIITCDLNVALTRAKIREGKTQRHIPPETLIQRHEAVLALLPDIAGLSNRFFKYENNSNNTLPTLTNELQLQFIG